MTGTAVPPVQHLLMIFVMEAYSMLRSSKEHVVLRRAQACSADCNQLASAKSGNNLLAGLSFAGVHDSFWTHAGSVDDMNAILRKKFLELHSQPLLQNLRNELLEESPELDIPDVPQLGGLALESITDAKYFFN